jgi:hypothetical protein
MIGIISPLGNFIFKIKATKMNDTFSPLGSIIIQIITIALDLMAVTKALDLMTGTEALDLMTGTEALDLMTGT